MVLAWVSLPSRPTAWQCPGSPFRVTGGTFAVTCSGGQIQARIVGTRWNAIQHAACEGCTSTQRIQHTCLLWYCPYSWGLLLKASAGVARPPMVPLFGYSWRWRGLRDCAFPLYCTNPIHPCLGQWRMKLGERHPLVHSRGVYS